MSTGTFSLNMNVDLKRCIYKYIKARHYKEHTMSSNPKLFPSNHSRDKKN